MWIILLSSGYKEEKRFDTSEFMYVMKNESRQEVDIHAFEYDENGKNTYGVEYPFGSLTGSGIIDGQIVNCTNPTFMFKFKTWYEPKEKDFHDVRALSENFGFELPSRYAKWVSNLSSLICAENERKRRSLDSMIDL